MILLQVAVGPQSFTTGIFRIEYRYDLYRICLRGNSNMLWWGLLRALYAHSLLPTFLFLLTRVCYWATLWAAWNMNTFFVYNMYLREVMNVNWTPRRRQFIWKTHPESASETKAIYNAFRTSSLNYSFSNQ